MRSAHEAARQLDVAMKMAVPAEVAKGFLMEEISRNPHLKRSVANYCHSNGVGKQVVRVRADYRYSTVGLLWDASGNPTNFGGVADLYSQGIGQTDGILGNLTQAQTNVLAGAKQDSSELFLAFKHGFTVYVLAQGATPATINQQVVALNAAMNYVSASLQTGTQTVQIFGPLVNMPGFSVGFQNGGGTVATSIAPTTAAAGTNPAVTTVAVAQGWQSLCPLAPPVELGAGESYRVKLTVQEQVGSGSGQATFPSGAGYEDFAIAIRHCFYGRTITGISA